MKRVVTCNEEGVPTGTLGVDVAHSGPGILHLAFSVFIFRDNKRELLIQKRASHKNRFPGIWANTCCSHPAENEDILDAGKRRLQEELGLTVDTLIKGNSFIYRAKDPKSSFSEFEYDTILLGEVDGDIDINLDPDEIDEYKWITISDLQDAIKKNPEDFAPWLPLALSVL